MEPNVDRGMWAIVALLIAVVIGAAIMLIFPDFVGNVVDEMTSLMGRPLNIVNKGNTSTNIKIPDEYVLAADDDFEQVLDGSGEFSHFIYIGTDELVEVPHVIQGIDNVSYFGMFEGLNHVRGVASTNKGVVNANNMFRSLNSDGSAELTLKYIDTSNIKEMKGMFSGANINAVDMNDINLASLESAYGMFGNSSIGEVNIGNGLNGTFASLTSMFQGSNIGSGLDFSKVNFSNVAGIGSFARESVIGGDVTFGSITASIPEDAQDDPTAAQLFSDAVIEGNLKVGDIDLKADVYAGSMFNGTQANNISVGNITLNSASSAESTFKNTKTGSLSVGNISITSGISVDSNFEYLEADKLEVGNIHVMTHPEPLYGGSSTSAVRMFRGMSITNSANIGNITLEIDGSADDMFAGANVPSLHVGDINYVPVNMTSNVNAVASSMFERVTASEIHVGSMNLMTAYGGANMFAQSNVDSLTVGDISMTSDYNTGQLFRDANIKSIKFGDINLSAGYSAADLFSQLTADTLDVGSITVSQIYSENNPGFAYFALASMFERSVIDNVKVDGITAPTAYTLASFFQDAELGKVSLGVVNTPSVTDFTSMYQGAALASDFDYEAFDYSNAKNMGSFFENHILGDIDLSILNSSEILGYGRMFEGSTIKGDLLDVSPLYSSKTINMTRMFKDLKVKTLDLRGFTLGVDYAEYPYGIAEFLEGSVIEEILVKSLADKQALMEESTTPLTTKITVE